MLNKVTVIGRLGRENDLKETINGNKVLNNSVAITEKYKDKSGQQKENTTWINFNIWQKGAEIFNQYTQKGSLVYLEGKWTNDEYEKDGQKRIATKLEVKEFKFLDTKGGAQKVNSNSQFANDNLGF